MCYFGKFTDTEYLVQNRMLSGLLPDVLLEGYTFWRTGKNMIRGYGKNKIGTLRKHELGADATAGMMDLPLRFRKLTEAPPAEDESSGDPTPNSGDETRDARWWKGSEIVIRLHRTKDTGILHPNLH